MIAWSRHLIDEDSLQLCCDKAADAVRALWSDGAQAELAGQVVSAAAVMPKGASVGMAVEEVMFRLFMNRQESGRQ